MSSISTAFGNITEILEAVAGLVPSILLVIIAIIPIILIVAVVALLKGWFGDLGKMMKFGK